MTTRTFLLLGTNLGDRKKNLAEARRFIQQSVGSIQQSSSVYQTAAWGKTDQPDFYNQAVEVETELTPEKMLEEILRIEKQMGRMRIEKWGERMIDIDILLYDEVVINTTSLTIPHPRLPNRRFALEPLTEIAQSFIHPVLKTEIRTILEACEDGLTVVKIAE